MEEVRGHVFRTSNIFQGFLVEASLEIRNFNCYILFLRRSCKWKYFENTRTKVPKWPPNTLSNLLYLKTRCNSLTWFWVPSCCYFSEVNLWMEGTVVEGLECDSSGELRMCTGEVFSRKWFSLLYFRNWHPLASSKATCPIGFCLRTSTMATQRWKWDRGSFNSAGNNCVSALGWGKSFQ